MIDEEWLEKLQVELGEGYRLDGVHIGGTWAALHVIYPDGTEWAFRLPRELFHFPSYVHEVPNWLVPSPHYDVHRLNRKLSNLLGDPQIHILCNIYDKFFNNSILETLYQAGQPNLDSVVVEPEEAKRIWRFIIQTPAISYRLNDYATSTFDPQKQAWAEQALVELRRLGPGDPDLSPGTLFDNPLVVWGGAVSEGYFTKSELPQAVSAVEKYLLSLPDEQVQIFLSQMYALMFMLENMEGLPSTTSIAVFLDATGFFQEQFAAEEERTAPDEFGSLLETIKRMERNE